MQPICVITYQQTIKSKLIHTLRQFNMFCKSKDATDLTVSQGTILWSSPTELMRAVFRMIVKRA